MTNRLFLSVPVLFLACGVVSAQAPQANYDESKVGSYTLPNPLLFNDGKPVRTAKDWPRRRAEILELFAENVYGHSPQAPKSLSYEMFDVDQRALGGTAIRKQVSINLSSRKDGPKEDLLIYIPAGAGKPVPVILSLNFFGNQASANDPAIRLATVWDPKTHGSWNGALRRRPRP